MEPIAAVLRNQHIPGCRGRWSCPELGKTLGKPLLPSSWKTGFAFSQERHFCSQPIDLPSAGMGNSDAFSCHFLGSLVGLEDLGSVWAMAGSDPVGKSSSRESWNCIRVEKSRITVTQCNRLSNEANISLPGACLWTFLSSSTHFPRRRD